MFQNTNTVGPALITCLLGVVLVFAPSLSDAQNFSIQPVIIYGDGNPDNGIEDSREPLIPMAQKGNSPVDRQMSAGTISCDGKVRGTAVVIDTQEFAPDLEGVLLVSSAHVLFDLEKNRLFRRCSFKFMGWEGAAYRSKIDLKDVHMGDFDPMQATAESGFGEGDWVFLYLRKPWKRFNPDQGLQLRDFAFTQVESYQQSGGEFRLLAYDREAGMIAVSEDCTVVESNDDDIGGGAWQGQLLDDCDSGDGASGGGIVAVIEQNYILIGIRNGSHWSRKAYPDDGFPTGPPPGSAWNRHSNSNFGRAIDAYLLHEIGYFIQKLRKKYVL